MVLLRSKAILHDDAELEAKLDQEIKEVEAQLSKEGMEELLRQSLNYLEKAYWTNKIKQSH